MLKNKERRVKRDAKDARGTRETREAREAKEASEAVYMYRMVVLDQDRRGGQERFLAHPMPPRHSFQ
jgi:hypothetical protein